MSQQRLQDTPECESLCQKGLLYQKLKQKEWYKQESTILQHPHETMDLGKGHQWMLKP